MTEKNIKRKGKRKKWDEGEIESRGREAYAEA